ncbi:MAG: hypothetical protein ABI597_10525 [Gammaproteobacteria bacterium]
MGVNREFKIESKVDAAITSQPPAAQKSLVFQTKSDISGDNTCVLDTAIGVPDLLSLVFDYVVENTIYDRKFSFFNNMKSRLTIQLASDLLWGRPEKTVLMSKQYPKIFRDMLLHKMMTTVGPNGTPPPVPATPYQLLLWNDDKHIKDDQGRTYQEMMRDLVIDLHGVDVEAEQRESWFEGWDEKAHIQELKAEFDKVAKVFDESTVTTDDELARDTKLQAAIQTFEQYLSGVSKRTRKNCIRELWDYVAVFYDIGKFQAYGGYVPNNWADSPKNKLFCHKILGLIDRNLAAWGMQVLVHGVYYIAEGQVDVARVDVTSYYASPAISLSLPGSLTLGDNSFMDMFGARFAWQWPFAGRAAEPQCRGPEYSILCKQAKTSPRPDQSPSL